MIEKPFCIIIGAMKSATTSLFFLLKENTNIDVSNVKDTKFFLEEENLGNWNKGNNWYLSQFTDNGKINLEASTQYSKFPDYKFVPQRIASTLKDVKFIYLIRNPIDRAISHYFHNRIKDNEKTDINSAFSDINSKYYNYSNYLMQINCYLQYFDKSNILFENVIDFPNKENSVNNILKFILNDNFASQHIQKLEKRNSFTDLNNNGKNYENEKLIDLRNKNEINKIQMAYEYGLNKKILSKMMYTLQDNYIEFASTFGLNEINWIENYETYL